MTKITWVKQHRSVLYLVPFALVLIVEWSDGFPWRRLGEKSALYKWKLVTHFTRVT